MLEPWSSGYGRRLMLQRLWVQILAPKTDGHFSHLFVVKIVMCVWKDENKWKRGRGWPVLTNKYKCYIALIPQRTRPRKMLELDIFLFALGLLCFLFTPRRLRQRQQWQQRRQQRLRRQRRQHLQWCLRYFLLLYTSVSVNVAEELFLLFKRVMNYMSIR